MALALDGSAHAVDNTTGSDATVTLTTSSSNDVIVLMITINDTTVSSVSSSNVTGWGLRKQQAVSGGGFYIEEWAGVAASPLSSEVITVTFTGTSEHCVIDAIGISGADTSTKWDSNGALPDGQTTGTCSITTTNSDDFLIGGYRFGSEQNPTEGAGWTKVSGADASLLEYKIVSTTQSALSVGIGTGNGNQNAGIGDAIIQGGAVGRRWIFGSNLLP